MQQAKAAKAPQPSAPQKDEKQLLWLSLQAICLNCSAMLLLLGVRTVARTYASLRRWLGAGSLDLNEGITQFTKLSCHDVPWPSAGHDFLVGEGHPALAGSKDPVP